MPEVRTPPRIFHRLFLECDDDSSGSSFTIRVSPDPGQAYRQAESLHILRCSTLEELASCLSGLGADAVSRFVGEGSDGPLFNYAQCTVDEVITFLKTRAPVQFRCVTLIASDVSIDEMKHRIQALPPAFVRSDPSAA